MATIVICNIMSSSKVDVHSILLSYKFHKTFENKSLLVGNIHVEALTTSTSLIIEQQCLYTDTLPYTPPTKAYMYM